MSVLIWQKELSKTDAQQKTTGWRVPYLRLTKSSLVSEDFQTWFRDTFFANANWQVGTYGRKTGLEVAHVGIMVSINGSPSQTERFMITHDPDRCKKHSAPNTWLHWPDKIRETFQKNDFTGRTVLLNKNAADQFSLKI